MKKKLVALILCFTFICGISISVYASDNLPMIVDQAGLLSESEETALESKAQTLRNTYGLDIVILTLDSLNDASAQHYADDYFDTNGYGYGDDYSGILFLLSMEEREWYISTCGKGIYILTDYGIQEIAENAFSYLQNENYATVFDVYLNSLSEYIEAYDNSSPVDGQADYSGDYYHGDQDDSIYYEEEFSPSILLSLISGIVVAAITILIMRWTMNTKRKQPGAGNYLKTGSFHLKRQQDLFLYSNVSKVRRQQNTSSGNRGGSSVHRSSSGRRHGGGGGRF